MSITELNPIDLSSDMIDSRDIIDRIEYLEGIKPKKRTQDEKDELADLKKLAEQCEGCSDWEYGEQLIAETYFTEYIKDLIEDCYELPNDEKMNQWPFSHMSMNYEAAAHEAQQDYISVQIQGYDFFIRS